MDPESSLNVRVAVFVVLMMQVIYRIAVGRWLLEETAVEDTVEDTINSTQYY